MKLIGTLTSPFVRKVRLVLIEKKIDHEFVIESPRAADSSVPKFNPLGRIPVLVLDGDFPLFDSVVIVEYIDNLTPNSKLLPATNRERSEVKRWEALADGVCDAAVAIVHETRRPAAQQSQEWLDRHRDAIERSLEFMNQQLGDKAYCNGMHLSLADIAVGTALGYLAFRLPEIRWQETHPQLARLYAKLLQRPSFQETQPRD